MANQQAVVEVLSKALDNQESVDPNHLSVEALLLLINTERLRQLKEETIKEFSTLKKRQGEVSKLHKLLQVINNATSSKGEVDCSHNEELKNLLEEAKQIGVSIPENKQSFKKDERDRLIENIRMTIEDQNIQNEMQMQTITRLTNDRYETYQMARSILKPLHEDKINKARKIAGG
ncbi:hypothetical protein [Parachlamydia sp. AcF125]|uniref:hypothetical protein n=1 Tax=Parachlamydia sp. AcF125 TaxID=2795736 RepID=UPI001BCA33C2|nr:hypothetical protein [Parachlamydia sp. AcF125]MBS4169031.1 hypothetical protein [Parachlamydia sp. AcF125]